MTSRAWYFVAALIGIGGIVGAVVVLIAHLGSMTAGLTQIVVPGGADLDLKQAGTYTIYHERTSTVGGRVYQSNGISGLRVAVKSAGTGQPITLRRPTGTSQYNVNGRSGFSALVFDISTPGKYRLDAAYDDGRQQPQTVLAVGTGFVGGLLTTIFLAIGLFFAGLAAAIALAVVVRLRRRRLFAAHA
jgi:hypothetical protein